jgi:translation initiation factor 1 (eIF-1/SUI1)
MTIGYYTTREAKNETMVVHPKETLQIVSTKLKHQPILAGTVRVKIYKRNKTGRKEIAMVAFGALGMADAVELAPRMRFRIDTTNSITRLDDKTGHVYVGLIGEVPSQIDAMVDYEYDQIDDECHHICKRHRR